MERGHPLPDIFCGLAGANARDLGQWKAVDPVIRQWYEP